MRGKAAKLLRKSIDEFKGKKRYVQFTEDKHIEVEGFRKSYKTLKKAFKGMKKRMSGGDSGRVKE